MQGKGETMFSSVQGIQVVGMSAAVSNTWDSLLDISDEDEKVLQKFIKKIGVKGRWSASQKQTTSDFCFAAAEAASRLPAPRRRAISEFTPTPVPTPSAMIRD